MGIEQPARLSLCLAADVPVGTMRRFDVPGAGFVALYNVGGDFYATADTCTHSAASLTEGDLDEDFVICPVHFGMFHVPTGEAQGFPVTEDLRTYAVEVEDGVVYVVTVRDPA
ncbi:MAG: Rieske type ferredoxin [Actinomycetia bacterium]|nr:Rieske type ferredoxin [Actinomycetes bacterium]